MTEETTDDFPTQTDGATRSGSDDPVFYVKDASTRYPIPPREEGSQPIHPVVILLMVVLFFVAITFAVVSKA